MFRWLIGVLCFVMMAGALQGNALAEDTAKAGNEAVPLLVAAPDLSRVVLIGVLLVAVLLILVVLQLNQLKGAIEKSK